MSVVASIRAWRIGRQHVVSVLVIVLPAFAYGLVSQDKLGAYSLFLGILLWWLPSQYLASRIFSRIGKVPGIHLLRIFYRAEIIKLLLSGFFFVMIIKLVTINLPALIIGYFASQFVFWVRLFSRAESIIRSKEGLR